MKARFATQSEINNWNDLIIANPDGGNMAQSIELAKLKSLNGWIIKHIIANGCAITIHERHIPILGKLWYIPKGPGVNNLKEIETITKQLRKLAKENGVFLIKIEPEIIKNDHNLLALSKIGNPAKPVQANTSTILIDVSKNLNKLMTDLPQKARYAINRAKRDGVVAKLVESNDKNFEIMLKLMNETMKDKPALMREASYYKNFWKLYSDNGNGALFFAYQNNIPTAGAFVIIFGDKATYKDGGSTRQKIGYGTSHLLQWQIIEWLKNKKIKSYDLCGVPPKSEINNKNHPHYGIGLFKSSFNKNITEYVGLYDIVIRPLSYRIWKKVGESLVYHYYAKILKKSFY
ncbi:MAG: peptidoglycan bridge formation glycyltransferase FemA/FemB family protein [Candidatus Saccharimonadales bacterium]